MKRKLSLSLAVATTLMASSFAQDTPQPEPPRPPEPPIGEEPPGRPERPPLPPGEGRERGRGPEDREGDRPGRPFSARRRDGEGPGDERRPRREAMEQARKPTPFIGVVTTPVPPVLSAQLGLGEGFGLVVEEILPDSPAKAAGLQRYDVIKLLNDQQLMSPDQLARLVRAVGKNVEATLTVVRQGHEQKLVIKVGERLLPERDSAEPFPFFHGLGGAAGAGGMGGGDRPEWREQLERRFDEMRSKGQDSDAREKRLRATEGRLRSYQEALKKYQEQVQEWRKNPNGEPPQPPAMPEGRPGASIDGPDKPGGPGVRPADLLRDLRPGDGNVRAEHSDGSSRWDTSRARAVIRDAEGEMNIAIKDGRRVLTVKGPKGDVVFDGPVDTPEQLSAVPEKIRGKLKAFGPPPGEPMGHGVGERRLPPPPMPEHLQIPDRAPAVQ